MRSKRRWILRQVLLRVCWRCRRLLGYQPEGDCARGKPPLTPQHSAPQKNCVRDSFPRSSYDVICLNGALDHFTKPDSEMLLRKIKKHLNKEGVLVGYQELAIRQPDLEDPICFATIDDLAQFFAACFKFWSSIVTDTLRRENAYFRCSDHEIKISRLNGLNVMNLPGLG